MAEESYENLMKPAHERFAVLHLPETRDVGPVPETNRLLWEAPVGSVAASHDAETRQLRSDILARIYVNTPEFFEHLIIDVLLRMGYANRRRDLARRLGRSHDGGIDGIIAQDELGLDLIYLQAKRLRPGTTVPISQVRDFAGSMEARHATKGLLVTTAQFTPQAHSFVSAARGLARTSSASITGGAWPSFCATMSKISACSMKPIARKSTSAHFFA